MPTIKAGRLGDKVYTARNDLVYEWGHSFDRFTVESVVVFWEQKDAEAFRDKVQALLEEAAK